MKRALITAGTSSIGQVIARELAGQGFELVIHYNRSEDQAKLLQKELGGSILQADLADKNSIGSFVDELKELDPFDLIVNNAGVQPDRDAKEPEAWERVFLVNSVLPAIILENAEALVASGGSVVNITSAYGHERFGEKDLAIYSASKAALNSITRTYAKKLAPGVRVNAVAPGYVDSTWNKDLPAADIERLGGQQLIGKLIDPADVAKTVLYLADNSSVNGEIVYVDGGLTLKTI